MRKSLYWSSWVEYLNRRGLNEVAKITLEALGPLSFLLAQAACFAQPFLRGFFPGDREYDSLLNLLEDPQQCSEFLTFLEERDN
ncbi:MAG: hypothetical protein LWX83_11800 [Anaerolineae bacterium]|nr:hypothetical protein [Anaerolineae bacterium]